MAFGVLAIQGDVQEHLRALGRLGVEACPVRMPEEVAAVEGLIIPGGESTTIGKLVARYGLLAPLRDLATSGRPLLGTCAGMILMAKTITARAKDQPALSVMDISVERNAFGRQVDSFEADVEVRGISGGPVRAVFIRAPVITAVEDGVEVLATHQDRVVAARQGNLLALAFHPELTDDVRVHEYFVNMRK
ncbi:MAG: pyridoxal 5'-phosphate synthase glutaminase subunit PdxT [Armatimonadetes bacterium]|nr:pyridoxal 5'-phosphate synthase glutaminase subunit PdxT [Armatimonadota bacterium]